MESCKERQEVPRLVGDGAQADLRLVQGDKAVEVTLVPGKHGQVVNVRVLLQDVAGPMVLVVPVFPPSERVASSDVDQEHCCPSVHPAALEHLMVAELVCQPAHLLIEEANDGGREQPDPGAAGEESEECPGNDRQQYGGHCLHGIPHWVSLSKQALSVQLLAQSLEVCRGRSAGCGVAGCLRSRRVAVHLRRGVSGTEPPQDIVGFLRVKSGKDSGCVLVVILEDDVTTGMTRDPIPHVIRLLVHCDHARLVPGGKLDRRCDVRERLERILLASRLVSNGPHVSSRVGGQG
mmetsp:Transcript_8190/g.34410  ORF Transcript_8190/g.34410 Transcript_8190/m.34410 type:complete len:292 (+) Transcript_8190:665-1540(+)